MVTAPIVLLIAVATTPDGVAAANEAAAACLQALPAGAKTVLRTLPSVPDDAEVGAAAAAASATATVVVTWRDAQQLVSDVRVRSTAPLDGTVRVTERNIVFSARDLPAERGRALGLVIASILDEEWAAQRATTTPSAAGARLVVGASAVDAEVPAALTGSPKPPPPAAPRWALEANVITAVDEQEDFDDAIGGLVALRRSLTPRWALRAGIGFRAADLDGANATARTTVGSLGVVWATPGFAEGRRLGFAARADLLAVHEVIKRNDDDDHGTAEHWTAGGDLVGQIGIGLSSGTSLLLSGGLEGFASSQSLVSPGQAPATLPRGRIIFELGVLSRF
ncbi:MAG TPA: hypothetical protein VN853_16760 [Polyangia bacterium]|jgi:hypothetical protein|nr:hypothetical protein [Polyangia bacterium]